MRPRQFEVFANPIPRARRSMPYVVPLQHDFADLGENRIVAPLTHRRRAPEGPRQVLPAVTVAGDDYVVLVPLLAAIRTNGLGAPVSHLGEHRDDFTAALDFLFTGF